MKKRNVICTNVRLILSWVASLFGYNKVAVKHLRTCTQNNQDLRQTISELKQSIDELKGYVVEEKERTIRDSLTGLYNRHFLDDMAGQIVEQQIRSGKSWGILYVDVDHFKRVNDMYGHATGDDVLKTVANIFRVHIRESDFIIRYGGDEFIILVTNAGAEEDIAFLATRLCEAIEVAFEDVFKITLSIGACFVEIDTDFNLRDVIKKADKALYGAKENGRNQLQQCS
jgi:two-component system cell cycle response regulator